MAKSKKKKRVYRKIAEATCSINHAVAQKLLQTLETHEVCVK